MVYYDPMYEDDQTDSPDPKFFWGWMLFIYLLLAFTLAGCSTTGRVPPPAPQAIEVLVPIEKPCVVEQVPHKPRPVDDPAVLELSFMETVMAVVESWAIAETETRERAAAADRPCGEPK